MWKKRICWISIALDADAVLLGFFLLKSALSKSAPAQTRLNLNSQSDQMIFRNLNEYSTGHVWCLFTGQTQYSHPIANGWSAPPQNQQKAKQFLSPNWFSSTINNSRFFFLYKINAFKKVATFLLLLWWYGGMQRRIIGDNIIFATYNHCCASIIIVYFR